MKRSFETWEFEEIQLTFGITRVKQHPLLIDWLAAKEEIAENTKMMLINLRNLLADNAEVWNEDELKFFFISPFIHLVGYISDDYKAFTQRNLSATINDIEISGRIAFLLAKGIQHPRQPFFCLHEYKQERKRENDPLGQLLISMLAVQTKNEYDMPIYGTYVIGRNWFFVMLNEKEYSVSHEFDASQDDIFDIFLILSKVKFYIENAINARK